MSDDQSRLDELAAIEKREHAALVADGVPDAMGEEFLELTLLHAASGLVVERYDPRDEAETRADPDYEAIGDLRLFGPFPKDTAAAVEWIAERKAADASAGLAGLEYRIRKISSP